MRLKCWRNVSEFIKFLLVFVVLMASVCLVTSYSQLPLCLAVAGSFQQLVAVSLMSGHNSPPELPDQCHGVRRAKVSWLAGPMDALISRYHANLGGRVTWCSVSQWGGVWCNSPTPVGGRQQHVPQPSVTLGYTGAEPASWPDTWPGTGGLDQAGCRRVNSRLLVLIADTESDIDIK